jgi:hypothetical protein
VTEGSPPHHDQLPLPDYDHLPVGSLEGRIRSLDEEGVRALLAYEESHGDRLPVVQVLRARLDQLASGAEPSGGDPMARTPEIDDQAAGTDKASPATEGPPINPPSQGDPTNPAQPRG